MTEFKEGDRFLKELQAFLEFLRSLWGLLTGVSVLFPLSNVLAGLIPLKSLAEDGAFIVLAPSLITAMATLLTLFVLLWTFSYRSDLKRARVKAAASFAAGVLFLVSYLVLYYVKSLAFSLWGWESDDLIRHLLLEIPLLVLYACFFASTTRAFMLLGLLEFYRDR